MNKCVYKMLGYALMGFVFLSAGFTGCKNKAEIKTPQEVTPATVTPKPKVTAEAGQPTETAQRPKYPEILRDYEDQEPMLKVFDVEAQELIEMPFEKYVQGVVAGEVKNDWPEEALKTQAIIARTFVMKKIAEGSGSKHNAEAHVSTDIEEAQAWDSSSINEAIENAVNATKGMVLAYNGDYIFAWFHSNSGGITALADEGLHFEEGNPPYIHSVESSDDSGEIPTDEVNWSVEFDKTAVLKAANEQGIAIDNFENIEIGERGPSGRAVSFSLDGEKVWAPELRIALGSMELKSTLIDEVSLADGIVTFTGRGYGHGVGVSQWGAYQMAVEGKTAEDILKYYFKEVSIEKLYD